MIAWAAAHWAAIALFLDVSLLVGLLVGPELGRIGRELDGE